MTDNRPVAEDHRPDVVRRRLASGQGHDDLAGGVLGGIDGCVTPFAVVAGATGGALSPLVGLIVCFANLVADGFSMAVSNYHGTRSERDRVERTRRTEAQHIAQVPEGECEEIRQISAQNGFEGETLERVVDTITANGGSGSTP